MRRPLNIVIPAAGLGSRFSIEGFDVPKPLIPILGIPMILWVIGNLELEKGDVITIVTRSEHKLDETLKNFLLNFKNQVKYVYLEEVTEGAAITVGHATRSLDSENPLIVINSDQYIPNGLKLFTEQIRVSESDCGSILTMTANSNKWSYVGRDSSGQVSKVVEKIQISSEATVGVYGWTKTKLYNESLKLMIDDNFRVNDEFYVAPTYNYLIRMGYKILTLNIGSVSDSVWGLGTPSDLNEFCLNSRLNEMRDSVISCLQL